MRISATTNHYLLSILLLGLVAVYFPGPSTAKDKPFVCCNVKDHSKPHKCSNGTPCNEQCDHDICKHSSVQGKANLTQQDWKDYNGGGQEQKKKEKEYPKLEGKKECFNYRTPGKKINCSCSHICDLDKGDPKNRFIVPDNEDYKCANHCKKHMCKCKTKCQT